MRRMARAKDAGDLHKAITATVGDVVTGVSVGRKSDRATWRIDYAANVTPEQRQKADAVVAAWSFDGLVDDTPADETAELRQKVAKMEKFIDALSSEAARKLGG